MDLFALPTPSTRCQQSVECGMKPLVWCGAGWEGNESVVWQNASSSFCAVLMISPWVPLLCRQKWMLRLERYWIYVMITSWRLILYLVWPVYMLCCQNQFSLRASPCIAPTSRRHLSVKRKGGVCFMINDSWCHHNNIQELKSFCSPDLEFLTIKCRQFYLAREFSSVIVTAVYIPPQADTKTALKELHWTM